MPDVGICEDDDELRGVLRAAMERDGWTVRAAATGTDAMRAFAKEPPDVLVLDIGLPDADGRDVCQALRAVGVASPVVFLTARDALTDRLSGFASGGDDYLTKPFALAELVARARALLRRAGDADDSASASLGFDPASHSIVHNGVRVGLTPTEFRLLSALAARPGEVVRREALVAAGWPAGAIVHENTLDTYVARMRRKLRAAGEPREIDTVRGVGYALR